jgi:A/G-specific adenine glycosylase
MTKSEFSFSEQLLAWFDQHGRKDLPWQFNKSRYSVWISEIMLQQTQVSTVIPYFTTFMTKFPSIVDLANAQQDDVLHLWTGLGYYARARNLHKAAQKVRDEFDGVFPSDFDDVLSLPGIGRSTAAAILSLADNQAYVIADGNVKRVLARFFALEGWPSNKKVEDKVWELAESLKPNAKLKRFDDYTQAIMDLGATLCKRSKPDCENCPVQSRCLAFAQGRQSELPHKKPKKTIPTKYTHMLIPFYQGSILMHKRPSTGIWGGLWGFYESDEAVDTLCALPDALSNKLGIQQAQFQPLESFTHTFSHFHLHISPILIAIEGAIESAIESNSLTSKGLLQVEEPQNNAQETKALWFDLSKPSKVGLAAPTLKILKQLQNLY